jgi:hypothetical protein
MSASEWLKINSIKLSFKKKKKEKGNEKKKKEKNSMSSGWVGFLKERRVREWG